MSISTMLFLAIEAVIYLARIDTLYTTNIPHRLTHSSNMTVVSNDPIWWPYISMENIFSYWTVAAGVVVMYDWGEQDSTGSKITDFFMISPVLTPGKEIELIWRQRWSLMTVLYLVIRYIGIPYSIDFVLSYIPWVSRTDVVSNITNYALNGTNVAVVAMLNVIMIARLHAMYQGSRMILIILVVTFLVVTIACGVILAIELKYDVGEELILSGRYICGYGYEEDEQLLFSMVWMLYTVWEVLALCLSVWVAVKHFLDLRRLSPLTQPTIGDCFRVLIQSHVLYFASFLGVSCLQLASLSPELQNSYSIGSQILYGVFQILLFVQMFVLGPRLILSVREYHAKLVADSDAETSMSSIVFQDSVHVSTSSTV
ncbi:uncharacterized protein HD556DRAFT_162451 [Suillus plorans]|uniref:DUF6533 domain-containing protein n=1 Tax=Suillus plorans TaxID=116603 RepID=A0A9P7DN60_9AGAM|nr:uncharacterized protein HD556DRAFT_162451 [Suillus plorans]KAG1798945.1 hypothetical protein HD556DRAFT_162451 [Suillus plorans]